MRPSGGGHFHATEAKISRFIEGTNNAFAVRKSEAAKVSVGSFTSPWLLRSTVRMSASHPKATESLRSSEMTLSAMSGCEQLPQNSRVIRSPRQRERAAKAARRGQ